LPDADRDNKAHEFGKTAQHMREIFYRMGFSDREIVALLGAHSVGKKKQQTNQLKFKPS